MTVLTDLSVAALLLGHEANGSAMICMLNEQVMLFDVNNITLVLFKMVRKERERFAVLT